MIRQYCDMCGEEVKDNSLANVHWLGRYLLTKEMGIVFEAHIEGELCHKCRLQIEQKFVTIRGLKRENLPPLMA